MVRDSLQRVRIAVFLFWSWRPDKITGLIRFLSIWVIYKTMPGGLPALLRADYSVFLLDAARNTSYLFNKKVKGAKVRSFRWWNEIVAKWKNVYFQRVFVSGLMPLLSYFSWVEPGATHGANINHNLCCDHRNSLSSRSFGWNTQR